MTAARADRDSRHSGANAAAVRERCDGDWVCVRREAGEGGARYTVDNRSAAPLTVTVRIGSRGRGRTITATLDPGASEELAQMTVRPWPDFTFAWTVGRQSARHDDDYLYRLPYAGGRRYRVLQGYGSRFSHTGYEYYAVDFDMPEGTPVHAARDGVVARIEESNTVGCWKDGCGKYANFVVVLHDDGTTGEYYHLQHDGALVGIGDRVRRGQQIALSGNTGHTTMPHLHFAVYRAVSWGNTASIPVRFDSAHGVIERPRRGRGYVAR
ncbi:MAG: M23 family metallopeptidase [Pseudomonadota bacterium]